MGAARVVAPRFDVRTNTVRASLAHVQQYPARSVLICSQRAARLDPLPARLPKSGPGPPLLPGVSELHCPSQISWKCYPSVTRAVFHLALVFVDQLLTFLYL